MARKQPSKPKKQPPEHKVQVPFVISPSTIMSPEAFAKWMSFAVSPEILNPKRLALLKKMSNSLIQDPAFLKLIERMLADYGDEIYRISPSDADLAKGGFGWPSGPGGKGSTVAIAPVAAAAALAPPAASLAAAHAPGE